MAWLLDTNIVSETVGPKPEPRVLEWLEARSPADLFLAAQTIGELVRGARKVQDLERRERFERWIEQDLTQQFEGRVLAFDDRAATVWGRLMGDGDRAGRTPVAADAQSAAVALVHDLTLVTQKTKDFEGFGLSIVDPWNEAGS